MMKIKSLTRVRRAGPRPRHPRGRVIFRKPAGFVRVSCGRYIRTHTRPAMSGLMAASASFISSALSASPDARRPMLWSVYRGAIVASAWYTCAKQIPVVDLSPVRIAPRSDVGSSGPQSTLPFITPTHRYADEYRHEFN